MKSSIHNRISQDALGLGLVALLALVALSQLAEPGAARNTALMGLVFLIPAVASAAFHFYRDLSDHHRHHHSH